VQDERVVGVDLEAAARGAIAPLAARFTVTPVVWRYDL
jgi:hypothetical protein